MKLRYFFVTFLTITLLGCGKNIEKTNNFNKDLEYFNNSIELLYEANKIDLSKKETIDSSDHEIKLMLQLSRDGIKYGNMVNDDFLNYLHPELQVNFKDKFIRGNELYMEGFVKQFDTLLILESVSNQIKGNKLLEEWNIFWIENENLVRKKIKIEKISFTDKLKKIVQPVKKSYWRMVLRFFIFDFLYIGFFSAIFVSAMIIIIPIGYLSQKTKGIFSLFLNTIFTTFIFAIQSYLWILWSSFCVALINFYIENPEVNYKWLYYITGFSFSLGPIGWFYHKERQSSKTIKEAENIEKGTFIYRMICLISFFSFIIWPNLLSIELFKWLNNYLIK